MKLKLTSILTFLIFAYSSNCLAQIGGSKDKVLKKPVKYESPEGPTGDILRPTAERSGKNWVVFSDRKDNQTYVDKDLTRPYRQIDFLTAYYVLEETSIALKVIPYRPELLTRSDGLKKSVNPNEVGWVSKKEMLLWDHSLLDPKTKFTLKAFSVQKPEAILNPGRYVSQNKVHVYASPELNPNTELDIELRLFQFLFVLKEDAANNSVLVAKKNSISAGSADVAVLGWVSKSIIQLWKERLCLEPNSDPDASQERKTNKIKSSIYEDKDDALAVKIGREPKKGAMWQRDSYEAKMDPDMKRFPVIEANDGVYKTGFITGLLNENGVEINTPEAQAIFSKSYHGTRSSASKINVVYVVDGNTNYKSYLRPILESINNSYKKFANVENASENTYQFGAVVYRNSAYKNCSPDRSVVPIGLSSKFQSMTSKLKTEIESEACQVGTNRKFSSLDKGMVRALRMFQNPDETNIVIIIGATGYARTGNDINKDIVKRCVNKNVSILGFQLYFSQDVEYDEFYNQVRYWMKNTAFTIDKLTDVTNQFEPKVDRVPGETNSFQLINCAVTGYFLGVDINEWLNGADLNRKLQQAIMDQERKNNALMKKMDSEMEGMGASDVKLDPELLLFLHKMDLPYDKIVEFVNNIKAGDKDSYTFFIEGYAPSEISGLDYPTFSNVILMDYDEWSILDNALTDISYAITALDDNSTRESLKKAYWETLVSYYGRKEAKTLVKEKPLDYINELLIGMSYQGNSLIRNLKLDDISDEALFPREKLLEYIEYISEKQKLFKSTGNPSNGYSFKSFNKRYYWVPSNYLP